MIEKDDALRLRIEALRVLARTNEPNRAVLIEETSRIILRPLAVRNPHSNGFAMPSTAKKVRSVKMRIGA
jgi:hypothetical protein